MFLFFFFSLLAIDLNCICILFKLISTSWFLQFFTSAMRFEFVLFKVFSRLIVLSGEMYNHPYPWYKANKNFTPSSWFLLEDGSFFSFFFPRNYLFERGINYRGERMRSDQVRCVFIYRCTSCNVHIIRRSHALTGIRQVSRENGAFDQITGT